MKRCPLCQTTYSDEANFCPMDAGRLAVVEAPAPAAVAPVGGRVVGDRFHLGARLGGGRTGEVYAATDATTGQPCVVKLVAPAVLVTPLLVQRTDRELRQLQKVVSERVARVLDTGHEGQTLWIALEQVEAVPLASLMPQAGGLGLERACRLVVEIGEALAEAAKAGVIHRDVALKNVLVASGDRVKLINFSLPIPQGGGVAGTPEFLSPEQAEGKPVDQRSNIYSLGALLYCLCTGEPPFSGSPADVIQAQRCSQPVPPSQRAAGAAIPAELDRIILKALEKQSSRRHLTLRQMLNELGALAGKLPAVAVAPAPVVAAAGPAPMAAGMAAAPMTGGPEAGATMLGHAAFGTGKPALPEAQAMPQPGWAVLPAGRGQPAVGGPEAAANFGLAAAPGMVPAGGVLPVAPVGMAAVQVMASSPAAMFAAPVVALPQAAPVAAAAMPVAAPVVALPQAAPVAAAAMPVAAAAMPVAAPVVALPQAAPVAAAAMPVAAPVVAPPQAPAAAAARGERAASSPAAAAPAGAPVVRGKFKGPGRKGAFRETMWFKKGELDEQAAMAKARGASGDLLATDRADDLPIEDRYKDDGTLTASDRERLSLRTGQTLMTPAIGEPALAAGERMGEDDLVREMKGGRARIVVAAVLAVLLIGGLVAYFSLRGGQGAPTGADGARSAAVS